MRIGIGIPWQAKNDDGTFTWGRLPTAGSKLFSTARPLTIFLLALLGSTLRASDGGSLLGTITDPSGAGVPGAKVTVTVAATAVKQTIATDGRGFYSFQSLPVGRYQVAIDASGFKPLLRTGVAIDVNSKVVVDASLVIGEKTDAVTVSESPAHVETVDTQMGQVITARQMTSVPLNGRSYNSVTQRTSGRAKRHAVHLAKATSSSPHRVRRSTGPEGPSDRISEATPRRPP